MVLQSANTRCTNKSFRHLQIFVKTYFHIINIINIFKICQFLPIHNDLKSRKKIEIKVI